VKYHHEKPALNINFYKKYMNIKIENNTATTEINLEDNFVLQITTSKFNGLSSKSLSTVKTTANMFKRLNGCLSTILDFSQKKSFDHGKISRLTKDKLIELHNIALNQGDFLNPDFISREKEKLKDL
jgi:hypothetical protein